MMSRSISPPVVKRRRVDQQAASHGLPDLRVYAWNINGIGPFIQRSITSFFSAPTDKSSAQPGPSLRDFLRRHGWPHMLLLQEVKIAPNDIATQKAVAAAVSAAKGSEEPDYRAFFTLPTDRYNARGFGRKVYGVCSIVRSDFAAAQDVKVRSVSWDKEGRFNIIETAGNNGWPRLSIWNVYAVNGTDFDYRNPETGGVIGTRHDRKLEVHRLMSEECQELERDGCLCILAGDMNVAREPIDGFPRLRTKPEQHVRNRADFNHRMFSSDDGPQMVDTFRKLHPLARRYSWFSRNTGWGESCDRVDYVICSKALLPKLLEAGMLDTEQERGPSDHVPVFACFRLGGPDGNPNDDH